MARYRVKVLYRKGGFPMQDEQIVELYWQRDEFAIALTK